MPDETDYARGTPARQGQRPKVGATKQELENIWRERVRNARLRYEETGKASDAIWEEHFGMTPTPDSSNAIQARRIESQAFREYMRVQGIFTSLVLKGEVPPNEP